MSNMLDRREFLFATGLLSTGLVLGRLVPFGNLVKRFPQPVSPEPGLPPEWFSSRNTWLPLFVVGAGVFGREVVECFRHAKSPWPQIYPDAMLEPIRPEKPWDRSMVLLAGEDGDPDTCIMRNSFLDRICGDQILLTLLGESRADHVSRMIPEEDEIIIHLPRNAGPAEAWYTSWLICRHALHVDSVLPNFLAATDNESYMRSILGRGYHQFGWTGRDVYECGKRLDETVPDGAEPAKILLHIDFGGNRDATLEECLTLMDFVHARWGDGCEIIWGVVGTPKVKEGVGVNVLLA